MADLQELFSRLKSSTEANGSAPPGTQPHYPANYQPPSVSSPLFSPPVQTPNPTGSGILSPNADTPSQDAKAANLLNLLRFNGRPSTQSSPLAALQNVAASQPKPTEAVTNGTSVPSVPKSETTKPAAAPDSSASAFLLNLLNQPSKAKSESQQPTPSQPAQPTAQSSTDAASTTQTREDTPVRVFGSTESRESTPFNMSSSTQAKSNGIFTYVNPFEQLSAPLTHNRPAGDEAVARTSSVRGHHSPPNDSSDAPSARLSSKKVRMSKRDPAGPTIKKEVPEDIPESWQNLDASATSKAVQVFNFPMVPFKSIKIVGKPLASDLNAEGIMDIVRLKKDFDQMDRVLVTATQSHIVYAMSKSGGFRVIRQDSGRDKQVFKSSAERIFHIQNKEYQASDGSPVDSILATGVNGSVYWTTVGLSEEDQFTDTVLEGKGFILSPMSVPEEHTSGGVIKTRSKLSSRNADLFAISKGKSIHLITPSKARSPPYTDPKTHIVDIAKYLKDRNLKISTGKACKDFIFSEDDSVIASLDKTGYIKFWDIRDLSVTAEESSPVNHELKTSVLSFAASMGREKISPTSLLLVDKERPCVKGIAHRYLLVGFKQNHSLQLWDLGLGKPVQELHFPHEKDSDAICSISYHPKTGIIALAHPTRNSIYFIHLSAPRYHIPSMDQATYISMLASEDPKLPQPESTAIMSGIRELSFAGKGQIRSVDMLADPATSNASGEYGNDAIFELYVMHSTGVTCVTIKKSDLGWNDENKVVRPVDAEKTGYIEITPIAPGRDSSASSDASTKRGPPAVNGSAASGLPGPIPAKVLAAATSKPTSVTPSNIVESIEAIVPPVIVAKKPTTNGSASYAATAMRSASMFLPEVVVQEKQPSPAQPLPAVVTSLVDRSKPNNMPASSTHDASSAAGSLAAELDGLYRRIEGDRRVQDAAANARQDAVLKLVSSSLTENVESSLGKIVSSSIQNDVLPAVSDVVSAVAEGRLVQVVREHFATKVSQEINSGLQLAVKAALQEKDYLRAIHQSVAAEVSQKVLATMEGVVRNTIAPTISQTIATSVQTAMTDIEARISSQRAEQDGKIDRLANLVFGLSESVQRMTASQAALQDGLGALHKQVATGAAPQPAEAPKPQPVAAKSPEDEEVEEITALMSSGQFEDGTIKWLQSSRQAELFDRLFVRVNPQYLQKLSPLVKLSVSAAVSTSFEKNVEQRLNWLNIILTSTDLMDQEIASVAPKIMHVLLGRIREAYMTFAESNPSDPVLRKFSTLSKQITDIARALA